MPIKRLIIDKADRLYQLPPELLAVVAADERRPMLRRLDAIDLASFTWPPQIEPDYLPNPEGIRPASTERLNNLKEELIAWLAAQHQVRLTTRELFIGGRVSSLMFGLALAYVETGDVAFVPDLGLPLYRKVVIAAGGEPVGYSVSAKNNWSPKFDRLNTGLGRVARLLFLNTPHNPTGAELSEKELADLVWKVGRENILVVNDAAYQSISGRKPASLLAVEGGKRVGVEVHSFSYQFGLPWLPFGFVAGNREIITGLKTAAALTPAYIPDYYIDLALPAIRQYPGQALRNTRSLINQTAAEAENLFRLLSLENAGAGTVPFAWARIERRRNASTMARLLHRRFRVLVVPGNGFGENGQGYLRFSLTTGPKAYVEAYTRLEKRLKHLHGADDE